MFTTKKTLKEETLNCLREEYAQQYLDSICKRRKYAEIPGKERVQPMHLRVRLTKDMFRTSINGYVKEVVNRDGEELVLVSDMFEENSITFHKSTFDPAQEKGNEMIPLLKKFVIDGIEVEKKTKNGKVYYLPVEEEKTKKK